MPAGVHSPYAVLDKLVPGYYHRRTEAGEVCNSTCCNNTATEHAMAERLVVDDLVHWARAYQAHPQRAHALCMSGVRESSFLFSCYLSCPVSTCSCH